MSEHERAKQERRRSNAASAHPLPWQKGTRQAREQAALEDQEGTRWEVFWRVNSGRDNWYGEDE